MAKKKQKKKQDRPRSGFLTKVVILALLAAIGWQLYGLHGQLESAKADQAHYAALVAQRTQENSALAADIAEGPTTEKIEEIARDQLGLVKPGEYVFDISN
jgi:cell division protein FtsB